MVESPYRQLWIFSCKLAMRNLSPSENNWKRSVHISYTNSIHITHNNCLIADTIEWVSREITILLQHFQIACKGSLESGHGRVPITKQFLFFISNTTSISCRQLLWKRTWDTKTRVGFSPGWRNKGFLGFVRWSEDEVGFTPWQKINKKGENANDDLNMIPY